jgi:predicted nucleotidyltransferase
MTNQPGFPTALHQQAADQIVAFFRTQPQTDAVLLVSSCARGTATPESDLDIAVLVSPTLAHSEVWKKEGVLLYEHNHIREQ